jgi:hypothetical protein
VEGCTPSDESGLLTSGGGGSSNAAIIGGTVGASVGVVIIVGVLMYRWWKTHPGLGRGAAYAFSESTDRYRSFNNE